MSLEIARANPVAYDRVKPLAALKAFFNLLKDKDDAGQVSVFRASIDGDWVQRYYEQFMSDPASVKLLEASPNILDYIADETYLRSLPAGSAGRVFLEELERDGIKAEVFREICKDGEDYDAMPPAARYAHFRRLDLHDVLHTVIGWGRDVLGEVCILEFQGVHFGSRGLRLLSVFGALAIKQRFPDTPVFKCRREARDIAKAMRWVITYDWENKLGAPMEDVRRELNHTPPTTYLSVFELWQQRDAMLKEEIALKQKTVAA